MTELQFGEWMSESDSVLWHIERDPVLRSTITSVWFLDSSPDRHRLDAVVERIASRIPRLTQRVVDEQPGVAPPRWATDPNFDVDYHYSWARLPGRRVSRRDVLDYAQRLGGRSFDKDRPLWELCVIEGLPGRRAAFVMKVHHAIADGLGMVQLLQYMVDLERDADPVDAPDLDPDQVSPAYRIVTAALVHPGCPNDQPSHRQRGAHRCPPRQGVVANRRRPVA